MRLPFSRTIPRPTGLKEAVAGWPNISSSLWIEPARALAEAAEGRHTLVLPTRLNLELLGQSASAEQAVAAAAARRVLPIEPAAEKTASGYRLTIPLEAGYGGPHFDV